MMPPQRFQRLSIQATSITHARKMATELFKVYLMVVLQQQLRRKDTVENVLVSE
jgi:hypothetical protein